MDGPTKHWTSKATFCFRFQNDSRYCLGTAVFCIALFGENNSMQLKGCLSAKQIL